MTQMHGGNIAKLAAAAGRPAGEILDFSANINPLGPPEWLRPLISARGELARPLPRPGLHRARRAFAERFGVAADEVIMGNGETELLHLLPRVLGKGRAVIPVPSYSATMPPRASSPDSPSSPFRLRRSGDLPRISPRSKRH